MSRSLTVMSYSRNARRGNKSRSLSREEVRMPIPKNKVGLVIGRKGRTLQEIRDRTGVQISIKDNHAHLRGTTEQCNNARELIEEILNVSKRVHNYCPGGSAREIRKTVRTRDQVIYRTEHFAPKIIKSSIVKKETEKMIR